MSDYAIGALDASTWDAFAPLAEKHKGMGFGGCWCTWFHSRVGRPEGEKGRPWKERLVRKRANCAARATFLNRAQGGSQKHPNGRLLAPTKYRNVCARTSAAAADDGQSAALTCTAG